MNAKTVFRLMTIIIAVVCLIGCGKNREVEEDVKKQIEILTTGNMDDINSVLFGNDQDNVWINEFDAQNPDGEEGVLGKIISMDTVEVMSVGKDKEIKYRIVSPDLSHFF